MMTGKFKSVCVASQVRIMPVPNIASMVYLPFCKTVPAFIVIVIFVLSGDLKALVVNISRQWGALVCLLEGSIVGCCRFSLSVFPKRLGFADSLVLRLGGCRICLLFWQNHVRRWGSCEG